MATSAQVMEMLIPTGGWVIYGDDFDSIIYDEGVQSITKKQFTEGFAKFDAWQAEQDNKKAAARAAAQAKLAALGLTVEDLTALGL